MSVINKNIKTSMLLFIIIMLSSCSNSEKKDTFTVVCSTNIIADVVKNITGSAVEVFTIIPYGQDPHSFSPSPKDIAMVEKADIIFVNGFELEEILLDTIMNTARGKIVEVSEKLYALYSDDGTDHVENHGQEKHEHEEDPHTWMSPLNVQLWVQTIYETLTLSLPEFEIEFEHNVFIYTSELKNIDELCKAEILSIPEKNRIIVTDHDVFGYFADEYGLENAGAIIPGVSTGTEISAKKLADLIDLVNEKQIPALFISTSAGKSMEKTAKAIQSEVNHPIQIIPLLTGTLQKEGEPGHTYLSFIEYNLQQLKKGLMPAQ